MKDKCIRMHICNSDSPTPHSRHERKGSISINVGTDKRDLAQKRFVNVGGKIIFTVSLMTTQLSKHSNNGATTMKRTLLDADRKMRLVMECNFFLLLSVRLALSRKLM